MSEPQFIAKMQELTNKSKVMFMTSIVHLQIEKVFLKNRDSGGYVLRVNNL